jgi:NTP pyrophosphatase (non-canonical NTP hydrolase)
MRAETIERIRKFSSDRDWGQYHTAPNIAKSIAIEAAELLECYQWSDDADLEHVKEELADVIVYCQNMLDCLGLDVDEIVNSKMTKSEAKYPVEKAKGSAAKYTELT